MFCSDGDNLQTKTQFQESLRKFLENSNCYDVSKINFGSIQNKSFNLIIVYSGNGEIIGQISLPILRYMQILGEDNSESCPYFRNVVQNLIIINHGLIKLGISRV
jgi:hypothetical protein